MPKLPQGRQILVNIPAFQLSALSSSNDEHGLYMKVVVGKYPDNQTPILLEQMRYLEFMPFWNIPKSILDKEIGPKIRASGNYLNKQQIELIESTSIQEEIDADGNVISTVKHGAVRARQRPGDKNPLGKVKFIFPNKADVYMHDTPAHGAFNRDRRDLSHGCVRVAEADKLAEFVLEDEGGWDKNNIAQAMSAPKTQRVSLKKSIPVMFFYSTAFVGQDNRTQFYPDIYGYDEVLRGAISKANNKIFAVKSPSTDG
jgi:murein L,D-transpeptidase YcbB/YkuD